MKSKLTLRIEEDVKESAKRLAPERGESLSGLVESYFRISTEHSASGAQIGEPTSADGDERSGHSEDLGPVIRRIAGALGTLSDASHHGASKEANRRGVACAARGRRE